MQNITLNQLIIFDFKQIIHILSLRLLRRFFLATLG